MHDAFPDLIAHRWNDLAKRFGVSPAAVQAAADELARLDPKPGLKYASQSDDYIIPDLIVEKIGGRYQVFLNDTGMPRLRLSRSYQEIARDKKKLTPENQEFIATKMNSANWMIQAIEQRRQTMLKVMNFIVDRQRDFFEKGIEFLKPLTLREVAEVINMHESTVSRVTNEKYVQTPRGVLPLKFFFSSALATASGEDASARSIRAKLREDGGRGGQREAAHRPADRAPLPGAGHPDRPPHGRQVPRPARHPAGPHAEAGMTLARRRDAGRQRPRPGEGRGGQPSRVRPALRRGAGPGRLLASKSSSSTTARATRAPACCASSSATHPVPPGRHPPPAARHRRRAPLRRRRRPRRRLRLLSRRPAVSARGHSRAGRARSSTGRADIVTGTKQGKYEKAFVCRRLQRALPLAVRRAGHRPQLGQGVPARGHGRRAAPARLAPLHGRDRGGRRVPARRRCRCRCTRGAPASRSSTGAAFRSACFDLLVGLVPAPLRPEADALLRRSAGATLFLIGLLAGIVALVLRFGYGIGFRPLLNLVETMVISGIVLFGFGLLGEMIAGLQEETRAIARALDRLDKPDLRD